MPKHHKGFANMKFAYYDPTDAYIEHTEIKQMEDKIKHLQQENADLKRQRDDLLVALKKIEITGRTRAGKINLVAKDMETTAQEAIASVEGEDAD